MRFILETWRYISMYINYIYADFFVIHGLLVLTSALLDSCMHLPILFRITSPALGQWRTRKVILKDMGKIDQVKREASIQQSPICVLNAWDIFYMERSRDLFNKKNYGLKFNIKFISSYILFFKQVTILHMNLEQNWFVVTCAKLWPDRITARAKSFDFKITSMCS